MALAACGLASVAIAAGPVGASPAVRSAAANTALGVTTAVPLGLQGPSSVQVDSAGDLFIVDYDHNRVVEQPAAGGPLVTLPFTGLSEPTAVAVDAAGDLFVADSGLKGIVELTKAGVQTKLAFPTMTNINCVVVDSAGDVFGTQFGGGTAASVVELPKGGAQKTLSVTGFQTTAGLAVDAAGDVFVVDGAKSQVYELPKVGAQKILGFSDIPFPSGIAVDGAGDVFVGDGVKVSELPASGPQQDTYPTGLQGIAALGLDSAGDLFMADTSENLIGEIAKNGTQSFPHLGGFDQATNLPYAKYVATDTSGDLFALDSEENITGDDLVEVMPNGTEKATAVTGSTDLSGLAIDKSGNAFVAGIDHSTAIGRVDEISKTGVQTLVPFTGFVLNDPPMALAVDSAGDVFAATSSAVVELPKGGAQKTLGFSGLSGVSGLAVDTAGDVYVTEDSPDAVVELSKAGQQTTLPLSYPDLDYPQGVAVNAAGDVYVANFIGDDVIELPHTGSETVFSTTGIQGMSGIALGSAGQIYVGNHTVLGAVVDLQPLTVPGAPTIGSAVAGNGKVTVSWTAPANTGGSPITGYIVTPYLMGQAQTSTTFHSTATSEAVTDTLYGTAFTFKVAAVNSVGTGAQSAASAAVTEVAAPTAPAISSVTGGVGQVMVKWTAGSNDGSPITHYTLTPRIADVAQTPITTGPSTTDVVTGLTDGTEYTFTVSATNALGSSPASAASGIALPPFATPTAFVQRQSQDFLGRAATASELSSELAALNGGATPSSYILSLRRSSDATTNVDPTTRLYFAYFLRIPDTGGLTYWIGQRRAGKTPYAISDAFAGSSEFKTKYGSLSNSAFVNLVYENVLGRPADSGGLSYWVGQLNAKKKTRGQVMVGFSESNEYKTLKQPSVDTAVTWIDMLGASPDQSSFSTWVTNLTTGGKTVADLAAAILGMPAYS